jgi:hypothetical protein
VKSTKRPAQHQPCPRLVAAGGLPLLALVEAVRKVAGVDLIEEGVSIAKGPWMGVDTRRRESIAVVKRASSYLSLPFFALLLAALPLAGLTGHGPRSVGRYEGIWKTCYEPGLEEVVEIDSGYLVLMPGGRYYELATSCCDEPGDPAPPYWELGEWEAEAEGVVLHGRRYDGSPISMRLRHRPAVRAVFFHHPRGEPVETEALTAGESIDYAWCRAYPGPEGP